MACEKQEGGFNRVFIIELDNGTKLVAKVSMRHAGPAALTTMSEVATMRYGMWHLRFGRARNKADILLPEVRSETSVPIPKVLAWSSKSDSSSVGAEYIIMEHIPGVALNEVWRKMTKLQHFNLIERMGGLVKQLCALEFGAFVLSISTQRTNRRAHSLSIEGIASAHTAADSFGVTTTTK